jgi:hypothetical protein
MRWMMGRAYARSTVVFPHTTSLVIPLSLASSL